MLSKRQSHDTQKSPLKRFLFVLGMLFFLLYFALGLTLIFWKDIPITLTYNGRLAFGLLLIAYAFFRFVRLWQNRD